MEILIFVIGLIIGVLSTYIYLRIKIDCPIKCFYKKSKKLIEFEKKFYEPLIDLWDNPEDERWNEVDKK